MQIRRTFDGGLVRHVVTHPSVWNRISDDSFPSPHGFNPNMDPRMIYLEASDPDLLGVLLFAPDNAAAVSGHSWMLPVSYGDRGVQAGKAGVQWIWDNTDFEWIQTGIPESNPWARRWVEKLGLKSCGKSEGAWKKDGRFFDVYHFGIRR